MSIRRRIERLEALAAARSTARRLELVPMEEACGEALMRATPAERARILEACGIPAAGIDLSRVHYPFFPGLAYVPAIPDGEHTLVRFSGMEVTL